MRICFLWRKGKKENVIVVGVVITKRRRAFVITQNHIYIYRKLFNKRMLSRYLFLKTRSTYFHNSVPKDSVASFPRIGPDSVREDLVSIVNKNASIPFALWNLYRAV